MAQLPLGGRSHRFANGKFQHMTQTCSASECRGAAGKARAAAALSPGESERVRHIARAAWWAATGSRPAAPQAPAVPRAELSRNRLVGTVTVLCRSSCATWSRSTRPWARC